MVHGSTRLDPRIVFSNVNQWALATAAHTSFQDEIRAAAYVSFGILLWGQTDIENPRSQTWPAYGRKCRLTQLSYYAVIDMNEFRDREGVNASTLYHNLIQTDLLGRVAAVVLLKA
jgi:hypothetical protein